MQATTAPYGNQRFNITLPRETVRLLDRTLAKGERSEDIHRSVRWYMKEMARKSLKKQMRRGVLARAERDVSLAEEWFALDEGILGKSD